MPVLVAIGLGHAQRPSSGRGEDRNSRRGRFAAPLMAQRPSSGRGEDRNVPVMRAI